MQLIAHSPQFNVVQLQGIARPPSILKEFLRLRHREWCDIRSWEVKSITGIERDSLDEHASYLILANDTAVLGGCRLLHTDHCRLPVEELLWPHVRIEQPAVEVSRICIDDACDARERLHRLFVLVDTLAAYLLGEQFAQTYADIRYPLALVLRRMGVVWSTVGSRHTHGTGANEEVFVPVRFDVPKTVMQLKKRVARARP